MTDLPGQFPFSPLIDHLIYAGLWLSFGLAHSLLAHRPLREAWKRQFGHAARLAYNALSLVHILAVLALARFWLFADPAFVLPWPVIAVQSLMALGGLTLGMVAARSYDMDRFLGFWQIRHRMDPDAPGTGDLGPEGLAEDEEPLHVSGLHARIRHPFYSAGLLMVWGFAWDEGGLATAIWATVYFLVGSAAEEHRLIRQFGQQYRDYRRRVPAYIPRIFWPRVF